MRRHRTHNDDELLEAVAWLVPLCACITTVVMFVGSLVAYPVPADMRTFWRAEFPLVGDTWGALVAMFVLILLFALAVQWRARWQSLALWGAIVLTSVQLVAFHAAQTTILDDAWYDSVTQFEPTRPIETFLALIVAEAGDPGRCGVAAARCLQLEFPDGTREWVAALPEVEAWRRIAIVERRAGIYSGRQQSLITYADDFDDWRLFWDLYRRDTSR